MPNDTVEVPLAPVKPLDPNTRPSTPPVDLSDLSDVQRDYVQRGYALLNSLVFVTGDVPLAGGVAILHLGERFEFLGPIDTERVLTEVWGNPPGNAALGMIVPLNASPYDAHSWGVTVRYVANGHVATDAALRRAGPLPMPLPASVQGLLPGPDMAPTVGATHTTPMIDGSVPSKPPTESSPTAAASVVDGVSLSHVQAAVNGRNNARIAKGYAPVEMLRWITLPTYLPTQHTVHWGKELRFGLGTQTTLNYQIVHLGRRGVLELNFVGTAQQFSELQTQLAQLLASVEFTPGNRYDDFDSRIDHLAAGGLTTLITGLLPPTTGALLIDGEPLDDRNIVNWKRQIAHVFAAFG